MSGQTQPSTALQALAEKLRTDAIAIFGEGLAERDIIEWFYGSLLAAAPAPVVPDGYVLVPVEPTAEMMMHESSCQHHAADDMSCPVRRTRRNIWARMLAAAPAHPAERQEQEALHVWRATTRFGETCHFGEASTARAWAGENGTVERVDLTPVPELRAVERQEQGEVQKLRDVLDEYERQTNALPCQHEIPERGCSTYNWRMSVIRDLRAALAASTGQEVR